MSSMNISIKKEAYEFLKQFKTADKSFSDVILGFKKENSILKFHGVLKDTNWKKKQTNMSKFRRSVNKRLK